MAPARSLGEDTSQASEQARAIIQRAKGAWLKNTDVLYILMHYKDYGLYVSTEPPVKPAGGTLYLFDKKQERYFRKDGHQWRKKANGKTVRETHEKLKVDNKDMLNCYYTHSEVLDELQRRCYWMLEQDDGIVLVHYLAGNLSKTRNSHPQGKAEPNPQHSGQGRQVTTGTNGRGPMGPPQQMRPPMRLNLNSGRMLGSNSPADLQNPSRLVSGAQSLGDTLMRLSAGYSGRSLPERASDATRELIQYGQALQAKKLAGEVIQPTAVHPSAFANKPLFMAIDQQMEISKRMEQASQHMATAVRDDAQRDDRGGAEGSTWTGRQWERDGEGSREGRCSERERDGRKRTRENSTEREREDDGSPGNRHGQRASHDKRSDSPPFSKSCSPPSGTPLSQVRSGSDKAEDLKETAPQMADTPFREEVTESHGRIVSDPASHSGSDDDEEGREPQPKRRRRDKAEGEMSQQEVIKVFLKSNKALLAEFKEANSVLLQQLQYQRQADDNFRRELMDMERERSKSERETLAIIASAVLGGTRMDPPAPPPRSQATHNAMQNTHDAMQSLQDAAASFSRFNTNASNASASSSNPFQAFPFGALAQSMMLSGSWPPPPPRDGGR